MAKKGWLKVRFSSDCIPCPFCEEEPFCPKHRCHLSECPCPGPMMDDYVAEYEEDKAGVLWVRLREGVE